MLANSVKNFTMVLTMVCLAAVFMATPKENTLGALITKKIEMHQSISI